MLACTAEEPVKHAGCHQAKPADSVLCCTCRVHHTLICWYWLCGWAVKAQAQAIHEHQSGAPQHCQPKPNL